MYKNFKNFERDYLELANFRNREFNQYCGFVSKKFGLRYLKRKKKFAIFFPEKINSNVILCSHYDSVCEDGEIFTDYEKEVLFGNVKGDDRAGNLLMFNLSKIFGNICILFNGEESGGWGVKDFCDKFEKIKEKIPEFNNIPFFLEFDRRGRMEFVRYNNDNKDLKEIFENCGFEEHYGSYSDISDIEKELKICGINVSCGYYNAHTNFELVSFSDWMETWNNIIPIITKSYNKFEYKEKSIYEKYGYGFGYNSINYEFDDYCDMCGCYIKSKNGKYCETCAKIIKEEMSLISKEWEGLKKYASLCDYCGHYHTETVYLQDFGGMVCKKCFIEIKKDLL